jgi:citrate lyase beta subunit
MFASYFFIPANKPKFIEKCNYLSADYFVFDLEDAITPDELESSVENLITVNVKNNHYVRFSFLDSNGYPLGKIFEKLIHLGFKKFIIPKFESVEQAKKIRNYLSQNNVSQNISFILLIEHPRGLLNLQRILESKLLRVEGISLGSQDYCQAVGMKHNLQNIYFARQMILNSAVAFDIDPIDIVSVYLNDDEEFIKECLNGFELGFKGKFLIHPKQLELLHEVDYYSSDEIIEAEAVYDKIMEIKQQKVAVVKINGKIYEKPHINRVLNIIKWKNNHGSK